MKNLNFFLLGFIMKSNTPINVVTDQVSNPVWLQTFIDTILNAIIYKAIGIYHLGSDDYLSRYEFAVLIAKLLI